MMPDERPLKFSKFDMLAIEVPNDPGAPVLVESRECLGESNFSHVYSLDWRRLKVA